MLKNVEVDIISISYHVAKKKEVKSGKKMKEEVK